MAPLDKNAVIKEAQKFAAKGQFDKAIAEWMKIAKDTPNDANVFNTIGDLCLKKNSKPDAVEAYQKAADILNGDGFTSKAIALYKKVLNIDPKKIEAHLALADLNAEKGLTGNALESYKVVADHYTHHKETKKALGIYQKMADMNLSNVSFRIKLGDMYAKEGMKSEAVTAYLAAADVHLSKEAFNEARQLFEKALALDPNNKEVYHKAGLVYYKEGKFVEACKALKPAFENDPANAELGDLYLDALAKAGRGAEAMEVYQLQLEKEPQRVDLREKLYRLCLSVQDFDRAFAEVSTLVNLKIEHKDLEAAEALLNEFLTQAPRSVEGKRALSALYKTLSRNEEAAAVLVQAANILDEDGDQAGARDLAHKALELAPDLADAKELRDRLEPRRPQAAPGAEEPAAAAPKAAAPVLEVEPEFQPAEWTPAPAAAPQEEDPAVTAAVAEIEVLVKYGLATKAVEQFEALAKKHPASVVIRTKLRDLYGDMGNMPKAVAHMIVLADLYEEQGRSDEAQEVLLAAQGMEPGNALLQARLAPSEQAAEPSILEEILPSGQEPAFGDVTLQEPEPQLESLFSEDMAAPADLIELPAAPPPQKAAPVEQTPKAAPAQAAPAKPKETAPQAPPPPREVPPPVMHAEPEPLPAPPVEEIDLNEIWAEAEFYYQQGLFDEARKHYEKVIQFDADNARALARMAEIDREQEHAEEFSKLAEAVDELEGLDAAFGVSPPPPSRAPQEATSSSDEDAVRSLMQEIAQLKQKPAPPVQQPRPSQFAARQQPAAEEDFFDLGAELNEEPRSAPAPAPMTAASSSSDDFFDLASELRDELSSVSVPAPSAANPEQQSLDEIFEDFKKGVEQQAIKEDADTHYNLGIAYKEMGLLDDAISEFVMTPEDEPKYVQSRYMLGLCYLEQGDYENSIIELKNALQCAEDFGVSAEDHMSMCFDLGLAYQGTGDTRHALDEFQRVYGIDPRFRDVAIKIQSLQKGGISQQQLKTDIEREISSKFLAEGERIQREEKTKKDERVPRPW